MKKISKFIAFIILLQLPSFAAEAQAFDFENSTYFTESGSVLTSSGQTLSSFDFSFASASHPLLNNGIFYPIVDFEGNNLWIRVQHIAIDPNGVAVGHAVGATEGSPFRSGGFGGWWGFLYQFEIYRDVNLTGSHGNQLNGLFAASVKVESIETLSGGEWVMFEIVNDSNSAWILNSINFTGNNPTSKPGFSGVNVPFNDPSFSTSFPTSNIISVIDLPPGSDFSEFSMSANNVSRFVYGYEYADGGGYQGMRLYFGTHPLPEITSFSPASGSVGTLVTIAGTNFDPVPTNNTIRFNGTVAATPLNTTPTGITVLVPAGATTGPISVTTPFGTTTSSANFIVTVPIIISPQPLSLSACEGETVHFSLEATGTSNLNYQWQKLSAEATSLNGLRWEIPAIAEINSDVDQVIDPPVVTTTMGGIAGNTYSVTLRFRGVVETKAYSGGTTNGFWNAGGTPDGGPFNTYQLSISDPPSVYYLNAGASDIYHTFQIDYQQTINIRAGATVQLQAFTMGDAQVKNKDSFGFPIVVPDVSPFPSAFNGQFIQMDIVAIDGVGYTDVANDATYTGAASNTLAVTTSASLEEGIYRCKVSGDLADDTYSAAAALVINTLPSTPGVSGNSTCSGTTVTLTASGATPGQYRWHTTATGGTANATQQNETFTTPALNNTTSYWVSINDGTCESNRTEVIATVIPLPAAPQVQQPDPVCLSSATILTASGAADGNYQWYENNNPISGAVNSLFTINALTANRTFQVSIVDECESNKASVTATVKNCTAPIVAATTATAFIEGTVVIDLMPLISDPEDNLDPASLIIVEQPASGAPASLNGFALSIDYSGFPFTGTDRLTLGVCDLTSMCTEQALTIELGGEVTVYNAISPNGDGKNEIFRIEYIDILPETRNNTVFIYNRWGDEVFSIKNYDNTTKVFRGESSKGKKLPTGTYFYKIVMNGRKTITGYLTLKN